MHHKTCRRFRSDRLAPKCAPNRAYWRMAFPRLALRICGQFLRHHIAHTQSCYDRLVHPSCWLPRRILRCMHVDPIKSAFALRGKDGPYRPLVPMYLPPGGVPWLSLIPPGSSSATMWITRPVGSELTSPALEEAVVGPGLVASLMRHPLRAQCIH